MVIYHLNVKSRYIKKGDRETRVITLSGGIHKGDIIEVEYWLPKAGKSVKRKIKL